LFDTSSIAIARLSIRLSTIAALLRRQSILARREQLSGTTELAVGAWDGGVIEVT
jgi:hypothetical protein